MLRTLFQILPVFIYKWLANKNCATVKIGIVTWSMAAPDIMVMKEIDWSETTNFSAEADG